jgi:hypothetical protein
MVVKASFAVRQCCWVLVCRVNGLQYCLLLRFEETIANVALLYRRRLTTNFTRQVEGAHVVTRTRLLRPGLPLSHVCLTLAVRKHNVKGDTHLVPALSSNFELDLSRTDNLSISHRTSDTFWIVMEVIVSIAGV